MCQATHALYKNPPKNAIPIHRPKPRFTLGQEITGKTLIAIIAERHQLYSSQKSSNTHSNLANSNES